MSQNPDLSETNFDSGSGQAAPPFVTLSILVAGVVGGVIIVLAVLLCCKYCSARGKGRERCNTTESRYVKDIERNYNSSAQIHDTINSDVFSDPSTGSLEGILLSPKNELNQKKSDQYFCEASETTRLNEDFEKDEYRNVNEELCEFEYDYSSKQREPTEDSSKSGRRVSFQLENLPPSSHLCKGRRYTDGDFHHLKRSRIAKTIPRQYSLGTRRDESDEALDCIDIKTLTILQEPSYNATNQEEYQIPSNSREQDSPSPTSPPSKTEVAVEIHYSHNTQEKPNRTTPKLNLTAFEKQSRIKTHSQSLDTPFSERYDKQDGKRSKSYHDIGDYDVLQITEFKGPFFNTDFDAISELGSSSSSKVRYNDTGSIEQLNDDNLDGLEFFEEFEMDTLRIDESDDSETINGTQKYRELWNLRTTFEEEEECSDTIRMEDMTSPDQSPDTEAHNVFDRNASPRCNKTNCEKSVRRGIAAGIESSNQSKSQLHPNSEKRRQTYKSILDRRSRSGVQCSPSGENSFDSITTDGDRSDTSRPEVTTTSFESTTDNTDSTTDSQNHRLIQMKADSGYKSLESQHPQLLSKRNHSTGEIEEDIDEPECASEKVFVHAYSLPESGSSGECSYFDRRTGKTASRKRREYRRERQIVQVYESINEPESDSKSDQQSLDSVSMPSPSSKFSVFSRLFKSHKDPKDKLYVSRDYSIDEKTNKVFQEFLRYDPKFDTRFRSNSQPRIHIPRHRIHRKHSDVKYFEERRRDRLAPEMRSLSLGSDSSTSSIRRLSPQDSIEEEEYEDIQEEEENEMKTSQKSIIAEQIPAHELSNDVSPKRISSQFSTHSISRKCLPEEEVVM